MLQKIDKWILWIITVAILYFIFSYLSHIIVYLIVSIIIAFIGRPVFNFLTNKGIRGMVVNRMIAALITILSFVGIITLMSIMLIPMISEQVYFFTQIDHQAVYFTIESKIQVMAAYFEDLGVWPTAEQWEKIITDNTTFFTPEKISIYFGSILGLTADFVIGVFSVFFISYYFIKDSSILSQVLFAFTPDKNMEQMKHALKNIKDLLSRYFVGITLQMLIIAILAFSGLSILGIKNALILAILAAFFNLIPYLGPYIGGVLCILIGTTAELSINPGLEVLPFALKILLLFVCIQLIDNFLLQPQIFSKSVKAHPLEIFILILAAGTLFGIIGMVLAIPVYTIFRVIAKEFFNELKLVRKLTQNM
jgi:predicted PurR-regulated permease PerM